MPWSVTLAGETFTDSSVAGNAYADEATGFPAILAAFVREAAVLRGLAVTSATLRTPATGPVQLTTHQDAAAVGLSPGMLVRAISATAPDRLMVGTVTGFAGTTLDLDVAFAAGAAAADWVIAQPIVDPARVALDPAPTLAADLDAAGHSIVGLLDLVATGLATFNATRFQQADLWREQDLGTATDTVFGLTGNAPLLRVTLGAAINLDHEAPPAGYVYWKHWTIVQDAAGGRVPAFRMVGGAAGAWPNDDQPDWAGQAPGTETTVVAKAGSSGPLKLCVGA